MAAPSLRSPPAFRIVASSQSLDRSRGHLSSPSVTSLREEYEARARSPSRSPSHSARNEDSNFRHGSPSLRDEDGNKRRGSSVWIWKLFVKPYERVRGAATYNTSPSPILVAVAHASAHQGPLQQAIFVLQRYR
jgi:hypothetical protein